MQALGPSTPREPLAKRTMSSRLLPGVRLGGYVVDDALGEGGMGQVYRALDERLGRTVALKILPPDDADDEARARFLREARALARVEHEHVVRVFASGEDGGTAWMALEIVDGEPLSALAGGGALDEETAVALVAQAARGLAAVHAVGVVHRDVKPQNILVNQDAVVKLVDFGVAAFTELGTGGFTTRAGVIVGTPHFMSPEQARGGVVDARSDAWSLGATLYALLTGQPPFYVDDDEADVDILARVLRDPVPAVTARAPATSPATQALLARLLDRDPNARASDLLAVAAALDAIAAALARGEVPGAATTTAETASTETSSTATSSTETSSTETSSTATTSTETSSTETSSTETTSTETTSTPRPRTLPIAAVLALIGAGVGGGALLGTTLREPEERIVTQRVEVPVVVEVPVPAVAVAPDATAPTPTPTPTPTPEPTSTPKLDVDAEAARIADLAPNADVQAMAIESLLARDDDDARAVLASLAGAAGTAGDTVMRRVSETARGDQMRAVEAALLSPHTARARDAIAFLAQRRDDSALMLLARAAEGHKSASIRRAAAEARDSIFKVED